MDTHGGKLTIWYHWTKVGGDVYENEYKELDKVAVESIKEQWSKGKTQGELTAVIDVHNEFEGEWTIDEE